MEGRNGGAAAKAVRSSEKVMQFHPVAELFDLIKGDAFDALCDDIRENGLREKIFLAVDEADGIEKIADGRNRFNACMAVGVEPRFRKWNGKGNLTRIVISLNLHRRHLTESQRSMVAAKVANLRRGRPETNPSIGGNMSQSAAAQMLNVSDKSVERARKVIEKGVPELAEKVESGDIPVSAAAEIADMSKYRQRGLVKKGRKARQRILSKITEGAIKKAMRGKAVCVVCGPHIVDSDAGFLAAMQYVAARFPLHSRYVQDVIEELGQEQLSNESRGYYERIFAAVDAGNAEAADCRRAVGLDTSKFDFVIGTMVDYGLISFFEQGGKTETARGPRKKIIHILKRDLRPVSELTYEIDDEEDRS